jgi:hypothetical protein
MESGAPYWIGIMALGIVDNIASSLLLNGIQGHFLLD